MHVAFRPYWPQLLAVVHARSAIYRRRQRCTPVPPLVWVAYLESVTLGIADLLLPALAQIVTRTVLYGCASAESVFWPALFSLLGPTPAHRLRVRLNSQFYP